VPFSTLVEIWNGLRFSFNRYIDSIRPVSQASFAAPSNDFESSEYAVLAASAQNAIKLAVAMDCLISILLPMTVNIYEQVTCQLSIWWFLKGF
jgi:hypothetical protein